MLYAIRDVTKFCIGHVTSCQYVRLISDHVIKEKLLKLSKIYFILFYLLI